MWLSNQDMRLGVYPTYLFSSQCSTSIFVEKFRDSFTNGIPYDEKLLPLLDELLPSTYQKNFYVIHLMGTHSRYRERYPVQYERFNSQQETGNNDREKITRAQYDNAVLYNDHIVNEIIRRFHDKNAIAIYISDHGEDVYDGGSFLGHFEGTNDRYIHEIPMVIWLSQQFSDTYHELEHRIAASTHKPYMTDDIIHTLLDIMSIETSEYEPSRSIINDEFDASRPRIYSGYIYDKETGFHAIQ